MKRSRKTDFTQRERERIKERDRGCIFCRMRYHTEECKDTYLLQPVHIMHYIPRSGGGLGIAKNAAWGCIFHHTMLDNGNRGRREEMRKLFKEYLQRHYRDWNEEDLIYNKNDWR